MNLTKLFETQKKLMDRIGYNEPDRFEKTILALLVEVGECANEWRGFKYWSKNQEPRTFESILTDGSPTGLIYKNPLLEEYVDGLHFVLQLGIELEFDSKDYPFLHEHNIEVYTETDGTRQFISLYRSIDEFYVQEDLESYEEVFLYYIGLSKHFNFTWEQIEQAYMDKNKVNHERQANGY
jgi:dimeric dUTPase (all-alpha-NTP-PPase superfamily)